MLCNVEYKTKNVLWKDKFLLETMNIILSWRAREIDIGFSEFRSNARGVGSSLICDMVNLQ